MTYLPAAYIPVSCDDDLPAEVRAVRELRRALVEAGAAGSCDHGIDFEENCAECERTPVAVSDENRRAVRQRKAIRLFRMGFRTFRMKHNKGSIVRVESISVKRGEANIKTLRNVRKTVQLSDLYPYEAV
jgi:hypothetical protein